MTDDDEPTDNVSSRFGPKRFMARASGEAKKAKAYKYAPKQEKNAAAKLGGRTVPGSGSKFQKGDVKVPNLARIECKATGADSFRVTREMVDKIEDAGIANDEIPFLEIAFLGQRKGSVRKVCVLSEAALTNLLSRLKDAERAASTGGERASAKPSGGQSERNYHRRSPFNR